METDGHPTSLKELESIFLDQQKATAEVTNNTMDLFHKMAQDLGNALAKAEKAERRAALPDSRLKGELELREVHEGEIQKLQRTVESMEAEQIQKHVVEPEYKLRRAEENRDVYYNRLHEGIELREQYEQEILKLRDLAWDKREELDKVGDKLKEAPDIRSKLEPELLELKLSVSTLENEKTSLIATLQAHLNSPGKLQNESVGLSGEVHHL